MDFTKQRLSVERIIAARWVCTLETKEILENHSVMINAGKIIDILPNTVAKLRYQAQHYDERLNHVLLPGFVNAHTHLSMNLFRGIADDKPLMTWLHDFIWPLEQKYLDPEFVALGSELAIAEMLGGGITCFNDIYFYPEVTAKVAAAVGIRAAIGLNVIHVTTPWAQNEAECLAKFPEFMDTIRSMKNIIPVLSPHSVYTTTLATLEQLGEWSRSYNLPIHMHVQETKTECKNFHDQHGCSPLQKLQELNLLSERFIAVHCVHLNDKDIECLANSKSSMVHCPSSNLKLASGFAPVNALLNAKVNVAIGTDGAASNNTLNMFKEMHLTTLLAKGLANDATSVPAYQTLYMATMGGAKAIGLADKIGSIHVGKAADLITVDMAEANSQPLYDIYSHLVYAVNQYQVQDVWVSGQQLLRNREYLTLDKKDLLARVGLVSEKIMHSL